LKLPFLDEWEAGSMPRITPVGDDAKGPHEPHFERSRQLWGTVPSFYRALAHSPEALEHIIALTKALRGQWRGEPARMRLMQLAILVPSIMNQCVI
jgi:alkylhydroperoxidase family enzyme